MRCLLLVLFSCALSTYGADSPRYAAAVALYKAGKFEAALREFDASQKQGEAAVDAPFYRGVCLVHLGQWERAAAELTAYANAHSNDYLAWYWLAQARLYGRQFPEARAAIQRATALDGNSADAYRALGEIELQLRNNDAAYRAWLKANQLNRLDAQTTYYLGRLFFEADVMNESAAWFRETLKLAPAHVAAMTYLAMCAERLNAQKTALDLYVTAIHESKKQNHPFAWAYLNYAKLLRAMGKDNEALGILEEGEKLCPEAHILTVLGQMLASRKDNARAIEVLRRAIAMDASIPDAHYRLALLLQVSGQTEEARKEMERFHETKDAAERNKSSIQAIRKAG